MNSHHPLVFIVGTRAQLIKVAPVITACEHNQLSVHLLLTEQHKETMQELIKEFGIVTKPVSTLNAREHSTVGALICWLPLAYSKIHAYLQYLKKNFSSLDVIVHGDTLSTLLGAVAGWRVGARVIHIESGLTSGKFFNPFPEEIIRRIVFRLENVAMCPNEKAMNHMHRYQERCYIFNTRGNTIIDAVALMGAADTLCNQPSSYFVVSLHRFTNIYNKKRLKYLVSLLGAVATQSPIYFILHPATRKRLSKGGFIEQLKSNSKITLLPRMGYSDFLHLAAGADCVLTDGGSNQEELAALGIPTVIMRKATERPDGLGRNVIMEKKIQNRLEDYLLGHEFTTLRSHPLNYNTAKPSEFIANFLAGTE